MTNLPEDAHKAADEVLKGKNVEIHYNTNYTESLKKEKGFDLVIQCTGNKYKADFLKKNFATAIAKNGQVFVNEHFQISGADHGKALKDNIFVFGDFAKTPINEIKNIPSLKFLGPFAIQSINSVGKGSALSSPMPKKFPTFVAVSVGPSFGIFVQNTAAYPGEGNGAIKFSLCDDYIKIWKGDNTLLQGNNAYLKSTYDDLVSKL